jgi:DNA-binding response OmpR family regulator
MAKTCLIAEHDPWDLQLLRLHAERMGFSVVHVFEAQDVLPVAREARPGIVILERDLPGSLGYQDIVCGLQSDPATSDVAIILFSHDGGRPANQASSSRVYGLQKPATYETLRATLEQAGVIPAVR